MWNFAECIISHLLCIVSYILSALPPFFPPISAATCHNAYANRHIETPHTSSASPSLHHEVTYKQVANARLYIHTCTCLTAHKAEYMHLMKAIHPWFCVLLVLGLEKRGTVGLVHCQSEVFLCFHSENVKVAAQGHYFDSEEKTPHRWFKGRSNEMSYVLQMSYIKFMYQWYELYFGLWCDTTVAFFKIVWHFYMVKNTKCKAGKCAH